MIAGPRCWTLVLAFMTCTLPAAAAEPGLTGDSAAREPPPSANAPVSASLPVRVEVGYEGEQLYDVPIRMANMGLSVGIPARGIGGVVYVGLVQSFGKSEYGLTVWETSARGLFDFQLGRLHVGFEPRWVLRGVARQSNDDTMHALDFGGALVVGVDVIRIGERSALQVMARGGGDLFDMTSRDGRGGSKLLSAHWYALSVASCF